MLHSNHETISHRFRDKRRFQSKIANFSHSVYLTPPLKGIVWYLCTLTSDTKITKTQNKIGLLVCFALGCQIEHDNRPIWESRKILGSTDSELSDVKKDQILKTNTKTKLRSNGERCASVFVASRFSGWMSWGSCKAEADDALMPTCSKHVAKPLRWPTRLDGDVAWGPHTHNYDVDFDVCQSHTRC